MAVLRSTKHTLLLLVTLLATQALSQQPIGNNPAPAPAPPATTDPATTNPPATTGQQTTGGTTAASTGGSTDQSTGGSTNTDSTSGTTTGSASSAPPTLTSATSATFNPSNSASSTGTQPPLPTLSNVLPPPLIVPDTSNAPFMQKSNLPEGTVFICVGAALGFLGLCVLAWRGLVAWSLHRSVKRAAETAYAPDSKSVFGWGAATGTSAGYKSMYADSNLSMEALSNAKFAGAGEKHGHSKEEKRASHMSARRHSKAPTNSSLFFSPTAAGGNNNAGNRSSGYLPAGFYPSAAGGGTSGSPLSHLSGPQSAGYGRVHSRDGLTGTPTPPDSPNIRAQSRPTSTHLRPGSAGNALGSAGNRHSARLSRGEGQSLDHSGHRRSRLGANSGDFGLHAPPLGRAPSMYLEDLFENHGHGPGERF